MPQSLAQILLHLIFSTKDRHPFLGPTIRPELHAYAATALNAMESPATAINSVQDHIHILCRLSKNLAVCDLIQELKTSTSKWIKTKGGMLTKFHWQAGYGAFSVSPSRVAAVRRYIENQEKHHRRVSFQDEFRNFLRRHGVEFDERYVWD
jgi:REP element-mobilizing transposase RayT